MCNLSWTPSPTLTIYVDVGHGRCRPQGNCIGKLKWTSAVKREVVKHSFGSAAEIAEEMGINVSQFMSPLQPEWQTGLVNVHWTVILVWPTSWTPAVGGLFVCVSVRPRS